MGQGNLVACPGPPLRPPTALSLPNPGLHSPHVQSQMAPDAARWRVTACYGNICDQEFLTSLADMWVGLPSRSSAFCRIPSLAPRSWQYLALGALIFSPVRQDLPWFSLCPHSPHTSCECKAESHVMAPEMGSKRCAKPTETLLSCPAKLPGTEKSL